jgi:hypothetical protein
VLWYDFRADLIHAVRTNAAATSFGAVMTIKPPAHVVTFWGLQAEGSAGPLDIVALETQSGSASPAYYDAQILPPLTLHAVKAKVSVPGTATFTVTDAGAPVSGAAVTFLGVTKLTNAKGSVSLPVKKGTKAGKYTASARKAGYTGATAVIALS